jgi:hypothetical protein
VLSPSWSDALQTIALLAYVVAVDALAGGVLLAAHSWTRRGAEHAELVARFRRAVPWLAISTVALGTGAWLVVRARYGAEGAMPPRLGDPAALPRAVHMALAACAVAGVLMAQAARLIEPSRAAFGRWLARRGALWAMLCTLLNMLAGVVWMAALPRETVIRFTGADTGVMITFAWALIAAILALGFVAMSLTVARPWGYLHAGTIALAITLVGMLRMREALRPAVAPQPLDPTTVAAALALLVAGCVLLARAARTFAAERSRV